MRVTIEIDEESLKKIQQATGQKKKSAAIRAALGEFLQWREREDVVALIRAGKTDYPLTNDQLEALAV